MEFVDVYIHFSDSEYSQRVDKIIECTRRKTEVADQIFRNFTNFFGVRGVRNKRHKEGTIGV